jgi:hypothetical protein
MRLLTHRGFSCENMKRAAIGLEIIGFDSRMSFGTGLDTDSLDNY